MTPQGLRLLIDANPHLIAARGFCTMDGGFWGEGPDGAPMWVEYRVIGVQTIANELGVSVEEVGAALDLAIIRPQEGTIVAGVAIAYGAAT